MGLFRKRVDDVDLVEMQRKGILQKSRDIEERRGVNDGRVVDLRTFGRAGSSTAQSSPLSFLDSLAGAASTNSPLTNNAEQNVFGNSGDSFTENIRAARESKLAEFNSVKVKLDDIDFKLQNLIERISVLEARMNQL